MKNIVKFSVVFFLLATTGVVKAQSSAYYHNGTSPTYIDFYVNTCSGGCGSGYRLMSTGLDFTMGYTNDPDVPPGFKSVYGGDIEITGDNRMIYLNKYRGTEWPTIEEDPQLTGPWGTVIINSASAVPNTALSVSGVTYIMNPNNTNTRTNDAFDPNGADKYLLKVESGVLSEDFALASVANWPDYVFKPGYDLLSLQQVEEHIEACGHLPGIPSEKEVKDNGYSMGEMDAKLLEKVEELTLYLLEQDKQIKVLKKELESLKTAQ